MKTSKRLFSVTIILLVLVMVISQCMDKMEEPEDPRGSAYAGSAKCASCHKNIHASFTDAAHNHSSAIASVKTVKGDFSKKSNEYFYRSDVKVVMEQHDSSFYQVAYQNNIERRASRFDIVIGSGRKAQTFLYWDLNNIFQLPVSWSVASGNWVNSPNYPPHQVRFDRSIPIGCFECHGSYGKVTGQQVVGNRLIDEFDRNSIVYGIDCERCHGAAAKHVAFQEDHPEEKKANFIASYSSLSRQQKISMCAVCHSGINQTLQSTFNFKLGDTLVNKFFAPMVSDINTVDVHGNQAQLLEASKCYLKSDNLSCTSCHNIHLNERSDMTVFSQRCITCHQDVKHSFTASVSNCIDCHMPATPSKLITLLSNGQDSAAPNLVRTHLISIYPEASSKFLRR